MFLCVGLTVHVVDLEQELEFIRLTAVDQQVQSFQQLVQTDGAAAVRVEQRKETLRKERLHTENTCYKTTVIQQPKDCT